MHEFSLHPTHALGPVALLALVILAFLGTLGFVLYRTLRGGRSGARPGPIASLALSLGMVALGGLGLSVFLATGAVFTGAALLQRSPVRSVAIVRSDLALAPRLAGEGSVFDLSLGGAPGRGDHGDDTLEGQAQEEWRRAGSRPAPLDAALDPRWPVHVLLTWDGELSARRAERIRHWLEEVTDGDVDLVDATRLDGGRRTRLDFGLELSKRDLRELEEEFEQGQPFLELPDGLLLRIGD